MNGDGLPLNILSWLQRPATSSATMCGRILRRRGWGPLTETPLFPYRALEIHGKRPRFWFRFLRRLLRANLADLLKQLGHGGFFFHAHALSTKGLFAATAGQEPS